MPSGPRESRLTLTLALAGPAARCTLRAYDVAPDQIGALAKGVWFELDTTRAAA
jgi:hypothetical protein